MTANIRIAYFYKTKTNNIVIIAIVVFLSEYVMISYM